MEKAFEQEEQEDFNKLTEEEREEIKLRSEAQDWAKMQPDK